VDLSLLERALSRLHALATGSLRDSPDPSTGLPPPGLQDTPQEEAGDLMYPPATPSCSGGSAVGAPIAADHHHPALLSPPLEEDDGDLW
jgi:hypothetical protein